MRGYRVAVVEPAPLLASGIAALLAQGGEVELVGSFRTLGECAARLKVQAADVVVVSASLVSQIEEYAEIRQLPIVILQSALTDAEALRKYASRVTIYSTEEELYRVIQDVVNAPVEPHPSESHELSERELDVLVLVAQGFTNKEIAAELNISPHTVISHRKNIVHKTGIRSVAGLTVYAVLNKFIDSEQL